MIFNITRSCGNEVTALIQCAIVCGAI